MIFEKKDFTSSKRKIKPATRLPSFILKLLGKVKARHGRGCCDAYVDKLLRKVESIENKECIEGENYLFPSRSEVAVILAQMAKINNSKIEVPGNSKRDLRSARNTASQSTFSKKRLVEIYEIIISTEDILHQRIISGRKLCTSRLNAFLEGVRSSKSEDLSNYPDKPVLFLNDACEEYHERHRASDTRLKKAVEDILGSVEANEKEAPH